MIYFLYIFIIIGMSITLYIISTQTQLEYEEKRRKKEIFDKYVECKRKIEDLKDKISLEEYNLFVKKFNSIKDYNSEIIDMLYYNLSYCEENLKFKNMRKNITYQNIPHYIQRALKVFEFENIQEIFNILDEDVIKNQYRLLVKQYHPDNNLEINTSEKIVEINTTYEILKDYLKERNNM